MGVLEDIRAAVEDGSLTDDQRARLIRRLRAQEWEKLQAALPFSRTATIRGQSVTVTITGIVRDDGTIVLSGSDSGRRVSWPIRVEGAPLLVADPVGPIIRADDEGNPVRFRFDPAAAIRTVLVDVVRLAYDPPIPSPPRVP